ncbi:MAG: hypothetical protein O3B86_19360 [Planctomycetota bacterium]|nr:hypothetical protein [Planctomycetota bacterium]
MKRKDSSSDDGSLDLLLDTICNTFGGVLFISLLVVVLLNVTSDQAGDSPPEPEAQLELAQLQVELSQSSQQLQTLRSANQQREQTQAALVTQKQIELARSVQTTQKHVTEQVQIKARTLDEVSQSQIRINETAQQLEERQDQLEAMRRELAAARSQLTSEVNSRSRTVSLPRLQQTNKQYCSFFLKRGRLTSLLTRNSYGIESVNESEIEIVSEGSTEYYEPRIGKGIAVDLNGSNQSAIQSKVRMFDRSQFVIRLWIWPDSFDQFAAVQQALVAGQFQYKPEPLTSSQRVRAGTSSGPALGQ